MTISKIIEMCKAFTNVSADIINESLFITIKANAIALNYIKNALKQSANDEFIDIYYFDDFSVFLNTETL